MLLRNGKQLKQCRNCLGHSETDDAVVCVACASISVTHCYECHTKFTAERPRCWLVETRRSDKDEIKRYAANKPLWQVQKWDPTVWKSTVPWGFNPENWTEEARGLPFCEECALKQPSLEVYDMYRKVLGARDLVFS